MTGIVSVIVDQREPEFYQHLDFGVPTQTALLPAGDVMVATSDNEILLVERKTPEDLLSSIADGRLMNQVLAMREQTQWAYVVITGSVTADTQGFVNGTGWRFSSVQGALLSVQEAGGHVIYCEGQGDFVACIHRLAKRDRGPLRVAPTRTASVYGEGQALLSALPGIGPERAVTLMKELPSVAWALVYLSGNWNGDGVPGIGDGTKARVRRALGLVEGMVLEIAAVNGGENEQPEN